MRATSVEGALRAAMEECELDPDRLIFDGEFHRFHTEGDRPGRKSGWYVAFPAQDGGPAGAAFGDWRSGRGGTWSSIGDKDENPVWRRRIGHAILARDTMIERRHEAASKRYAKRYKNCREAPLEHPYLLSKGILSAPHVRVTTANVLVIPMKDVVTDRIMNVQRISARGGKWYGGGGRAARTYLRLGPEPGGRDLPTLYLAEGYATAWAVHYSTGAPCAVCWSAANLVEVAKAMRARYPTSKIIIAGDDDRHLEVKGKANAGRKGAEAAARVVGASVYFPDFSKFPGAAGRPTDFNDLFLLARGAPNVGAGASGGGGSSPHDVRRAKDEVRRQLGVEVPHEAVVLDANDPLQIARSVVRDVFGDRIHYWKNDFYAYSGRHWPALHDAGIRSSVYRYLEVAKKVGKSGIPQEMKPNMGAVTRVVDGMQGVCYLADQPTPGHTGPVAPDVPPFWLDGRLNPPSNEVVSVRNGLLHMPSRTLTQHTADFFTPTTLPFGYYEDSPEPTTWLGFLDQLWGAGSDEVKCLQEAFGYLLSSETRYQKMFMMVGPRRSGKGTIGRVLTQLIGPANVIGPTLSSLASGFGLQPLLGKSVAIISDARISGRIDQAQVVERLLSVSGEDGLTVDRKHREAWTGRLPTRFLILTNEIPSLNDVSGALASRFVIMTMTRSFYGIEDIRLTQRLLPELAGILNWSLEGFRRLSLQGRFTESKGAAQALTEMSDLASPTGAFIRDRCIVEPTAQVEKSVLYRVFQEWCEERGATRNTSDAWFGRNLRASEPSVHGTHPRLPNGRRVKTWAGIRLRTTADEDANEDAEYI